MLDVACGTGDLAQAFVLAGAGKVIGLDYTPAMLDYARSKATRIGGRIAEIQYVDGDAQSLPYPDQSFDIVSIAFGIRNVADPSRAIQEFRRVLRPGGRVVILEFSRPRSGFVRFFTIYTPITSCRGRRQFSPVTAQAHIDISRNLLQLFLTPHNFPTN